MKRKLLFTLFILVTAVQAFTAGREVQTFKTGWKFSRTDDANAKNINYDDSKWQTVTVPHDWAI